MQATATANTRTMMDRLHWNDLILPWLVRLAFLGVGVLIGMFMLAPRQARASDTYLPPAYAALPNAVFTVNNGDGLSATLPAKLADTVALRNVGFNDVGTKAIENELLLFQLTRETTARVTYAMEGIRVPVQAAVVSGTGEIVAVHDVAVGSGRLAVPENHRWLLLARQGTFEALGVGVGSTLDPESVRKINY